MTLSARRLASVAGSETSYEKTDELLRELSELNFGTKRVERMTRAAGADFKAWRAASGAEVPSRKWLEPGWTPCRARSRHFERRMFRELAAAGWTLRDAGPCLGDGAEWIRRLFDDWFPDARKVVDYYHTAEYLWSAARARHGDGDLAAAWSKKPCGMLGPGRLDDALAELRMTSVDIST